MALQAPLPLRDRSGFTRLPGARASSTVRRRQEGRGFASEVRGAASLRPVPVPSPTVPPGARQAGVPVGLTGRGVALLMLVTAAASVLVVVGTMLAADEGAPVRAGAPTLEAGGGAAPTPTVVVEPGGSLWGVAVRHAPEDSDLRAYVADLEDANGVSAGEVRPGMVLRLPPR